MTRRSSTSSGIAVALLLVVPLLAHPARADGPARTLRPRFLPPSELARVLGAQPREGLEVIEWRAADGPHVVQLRRNDAANLILLTGSPEDLSVVEAMAAAADVEPRQISIEARIVEVNRNQALNAGLDWSTIQTSLRGSANWSRRSGYYGPSSKNTDLLASGVVDWPQMLKLLEERGAATFRDTPGILTLNNRRATILDGQRVTYVTRYSVYADLYATDSLDAGLRLSVLPSLGESGYLTLDIQAELTTLVSPLAGSPAKDGQMVENAVVVKDGETVLLGGFTRTTDEVTRRGFPGLGRLLPFLFSREIHNQVTRESFVVITPRVVDLSPALDEHTRERLEGR